MINEQLAYESTDSSVDSAIIDVLVIGGGINGAGLARDASGRGLSVTLVEKDDLAAGTSSRSGKLIHGGLRYLEYYEFRLVREALKEREVLLESAPHIIWPMRFVLPHSAEDRPAWLVRAGLFLYDHLGGRKHLKGTRSINLKSCPEGDALNSQYTKGFEFSDCWVDDARLVVLNALDAAQHGASILTRHEVVSARRVNSLWEIQVLNRRNGTNKTLIARSIVNAAGPWVNQIIESTESVLSQRKVRLVKGSHIVVNKFWAGDNAYLVQNTDKRVIFINPYENKLALIGTTDIPFAGNADDVEIDEQEIEYLLTAMNRYFKIDITKSDIVQSFSGVRPLFDDNSENPSAVTRDYLFDLDGKANEAPMLSVFGGKITTFRKLAEHAMNKLEGFFPDMREAWTSHAPLPGGDIAFAAFDAFHNELVQDYPSVNEKLLYHYARLYGTRAYLLLDGVKVPEDLGLRFSEYCYEIEARYLHEHEWALTADDILQRRTKHGLHMSPEEKSSFEQWFGSLVFTDDGGNTENKKQCHTAS